ncbi:MAG TPA: gamma-glutamyltransferase [Kofleriaceae bacterium]|nr:gamma-glutamyltransferase [Kofleriaceae bacterium]
MTRPLVRTCWLALVLLAAGCKRNPPRPPPPALSDAAVWAPMVDAGPKPAYRTDPPSNPLDPEVAGKAKTFMVVSESADATKVGQQVLASGGNAVDAAVATAFALAVTHPSAGNLGGGGFAVVRLGPNKFVALDFREVAPKAATETMFVDASGKVTLDSLVGHRASGVPGSVAGLYELHKKYGKKPWKDVVAPAIVLARDGFSVDNVLAQSLARPRTEAKLVKFPATAAIWRPNNIPLGAGSHVTIPDLAATLQRIAERGADGFYKGPTAELIVAEMKAGNGLITAEDLAAYKAIWREPLRFAYRGRSLVSMPLPSSGAIVLAMTAGMMRDVELGKLPWHGVEHVHRLAEVWKRAFAARNEWLGDPAFVKNMPAAQLIADANVRALAKQIGDKATPAKDVRGLVEGNHTTNLCVVDATGMAVALTTTLNTSFGSGVTVKGAGFLMNNEMDDFTAKPGAPNVFGLVQGAANKIEPGKRMLSSMTPTIIEDDKHELVMVVGGGGGPRIITGVWQAISNVLDFGKPADLAIAEPRVHHQHLPDVIQMEAETVDESTDAALKAKGHVTMWGEEKREFGAINTIVRTANGWEGAADPRGGGAAMGD